MNDNEYPPCIVRTSPNSSSMPIKVQYLAVGDTENLLDSQEELISTPLNINFNFIVNFNYLFFLFCLKRSFSFHLQTNDEQCILIAIPYIAKRSSHRENVIKIRQANGIWISMETHESVFDAHKVC